MPTGHTVLVPRFSSPGKMLCGYNVARFMAIATGREDPGEKFYPKGMPPPTFANTMVERLRQVGIRSEVLNLKSITDPFVWLKREMRRHPVALFVRPSPSFPLLAHWVVGCGVDRDENVLAYDDRVEGGAKHPDQWLGNIKLSPADVRAVWRGMFGRKVAVVPVD